MSIDLNDEVRLGSGSALLRYDVMTTPFPLQASPATGNLSVAQLTLVVSNPNATPVTLQGLILNIPVGTTSTDLTPDATSIGPVAPAGWTLHATQYPTGAVQYLFYPQAGSGAVGSSGLSFIFNNVQINRQTGTVALTVTEGSNNCDPATTCPTVTLDVTKFPNGWGQVAFWSNPNIVSYGGSTTLHWAGPAGATYTIEYYTPQTGIVHVPGQGQPPLGNQGQYPGQSDPPLDLTQTTSFYLSVAETTGGQTYSAQQQITVTVESPKPQITQFSGTINTSQSQVILHWQTEHANYCTLSGISFELNPASPPEGFAIPAAQAAAAYTLTAVNNTGTDTSTLNAAWSSVNTVPLSSVQPEGLALAPDGSLLYAATSTGIAMFKTDSTPSLQPAGTLINIGNSSMGWPQGLAVAPDGSRLYVVLMSAGIRPGSVQVVNLTTQSLIGSPIPVGQNPWGVAVAPDNSRVYVTNSYDNTISVFAPSSDPNTPLTPVGSPVSAGGGHMPRGIVVAPDGSRVYVGCSNIVSVFAPSSDPNTPLTPVGQYTIGSIVQSSSGLAFSPGIKDLFAVLDNPGVQNGSILVLDPITLASIQPAIAVGLNPAGLAAQANGQYLYVTVNTDVSHVGISVLAPTSFSGGIPA